MLIGNAIMHNAGVFVRSRGSRPPALPCWSRLGWDISNVDHGHFDRPGLFKRIIH